MVFLSSKHGSAFITWPGVKLRADSHRVRTGAPHTRILALLILACAAVGASAQDHVRSTSAASDLMRRRLYDDAVRLLEKELRQRPEAESATRLLMLGECHYLQGKYEEARPWLAKALRYLPEGNSRTVAEYRLACTAYRLSDMAGAFEKTSDFVRKHPEDRRAGTLLLFRMKALARRGRNAEAELLTTLREIAGRTGSYGAAIGLSADKILTDFYLSNGLEDKAVAGCMSIVSNFRQVSAQYAAANRSVPVVLEQARDYAAMQLAKISLADQRKAEAAKWLNSIRFDQDLKRRARLMLAQIAYTERDYRKAEDYLLSGDFIKSVPAGNIRSDMYLLLGFCAKLARRPDMEQVFNYFSEVAPDSPAYAQARMGMADTAIRWRRPALAVGAYEEARISARYEPEALAKLADLYLQMGDEEKDAARQDEFYERAAERLSLLATRYANSSYARDSTETARALLAKGKVVKEAVSDEDMIADWERAVQEKPRSLEAARALIGIARLHQRAVISEKTGAFVKAPDFAACLDACNRLLEEAAFKGADLDDNLWTDIRAEALYYRGLCHISSVGQKTGDPRDRSHPRYVAVPGIQVALDNLEAATRLVRPQQLDLVRNIEMVQVEAMFKADDEALRRKAAERFDELVQKYGRESRFQKLAMDIAQWHHEQGHLVEAARMYEGVAERGRADLPQEDIVKVLFMAGKLYGTAAYQALHKKTGGSYVVYVYPEEVVKLAGLIETHEPFARTVRVDWPAGEITARQALIMVSKASGIPFVWSRRTDNAAVEQHLAQRRLTFTNPQGTVAEFLARILDLDKQVLAFDIGLADGAPTIALTDTDETDPAARDASRVIEIYAASERNNRYAPMTRSYGAWQNVHQGVTMMFGVVKRIEELADTTIQWAEGVNEEDILATEYGALPGKPADQPLSCAETLAALLGVQDLAYRIMPRDVSTELYERAKACFNDIRRISPKTTYGEQSLFLLALNYYQREDYERMKIILQEYLKVFDSPTFDHYHRACFWVGWVFERERRFPEACRFYSRAAEESLVVYRPAEDAEPEDREALAAKLSYDTAFALDEVVSGTLTNVSLAGTLRDFVRLHTGVELATDPGAMTLATNLNYVSFREASVFNLLCDIVDRLGLSFRPSNSDEATAEKAYYRMAVCYKNDGLNEHALASCRCLLSRYPQTQRRRDARKLQLDIYKALKDYRSVLTTLGSLKSELAAEGLAYKIDFEIAWIYTDLCRYEDAARHFKQALGEAQGATERNSIRDGYARALVGAGRFEDALNQYEVLLHEETEPLRRFIDEIMAWYLRRATGKETSAALPDEASRIMRAYEALDDVRRGRLTRTVFAKVTWIYYLSGLFDLRRGDGDRALAKFDAAGNSPDDWLAAQAIFQAAQVHRKAGRTAAAIESLDYLLFSTKSAESELKALYLLAACHREVGNTEKAEERLERIMARFPDSFYARIIEEERRKVRNAEDNPQP